MAYDRVVLKWDMNFKGELFSPTGIAKLGDQDDGLYPYHLFFGAIGSCFYATFISVALKMRLEFESAKIEVSGSKIDPNSKIIEVVDMKMVIKNPSDKDKLIKAAELGTKYCSIHELVSRAAKVNLIVEFD
ncbi:MAG: OsmC family protein [Candidatus Izemoplasmatales bacterium]